MTVYTIVGAGGIGGYLALPLMKYMEHLSDGGEHVIRVIDGDSFEQRNIDRQVCSADGVGFNKARWLVGYLSIFKKSDTEIVPIDDYLTPDNISKHLAGSDFVFSCVDNDKTRLLIEEWCSEDTGTILINGGNEFIDGNVQCYEPGVTKKLSEVHKDMLKSNDRNPGESCINVTDTSPQLGIVNNMVAALMLVQLYKYSW